MKKKLFLIAIAVFSVGLLGSCSKINERIDNLEKKVDGIENERIASIESQITVIKSSISDLGTIRSNIQSLTDGAKAQGEDITALRAADKALDSRIDELSKYVGDTLKAYATEEWARATFATLEQYKKTCDTIAEIDTRIGELDADLTKKIADCADSLTTWINVKFEGYYTAAQMDAKLALMKSAVDSAKAAGEITDAKADSLAGELAKVQPAIDSAKASLTAEYTAAIDTAITALDGKLTKQIQDEIEKVNETVTALAQRVGILEFQVRDLLGRVKALEGMIQSVTIVPAYSDGSVVAKDSILYLDIVVEPAGAVTSITEDKLTVLVNEVKTKVVSVDTVPVTKFKVDAVKGTITARADISSELPVESGKALTVAVNVKSGLNDYTTEFCPVTVSSKVTVKEENDTTKVSITADKEFSEPASGNIVVDEGFKSDKTTTIQVEGIGTVTFDKTATNKIKSNAQNAGATSVFFKVEDVTTTKPVQDADVVLEVTMKAVNEDGTEVYSENKASGRVKIAIPIDSEVVFVKTVTLVDDDGKPVVGGVVPETIVLDLENHLLSFEVEHFSKYAVGYVKKDAFVEVTGVSLDPTSATLPVGDSITLTATVAPDNATNKKVTWSSDDPSVATVDKNGKVKAVADGTATITVTTEDGSKTATCTVTVVIGVTGVSLDETEITLAVGGTKTLTATVAPDNAENKDVTWSSSNEAVATVEGGKVTAIAHGTATITVTTEDGSKTATCTVKVTTGTGFEEYEDGGTI